MLKRLLTVCALLLAFAHPALANDEQAATELFARYVAADANYDPAVADMYAADADICNWRKYPNGKTQKLCFKAADYKALIVKSMPQAKATGDSNSFTDVTYTVLKEGGVRINATRYNHLKKYSSPIELHVAPNAAGVWEIKREYSVSQP